MLKNIKATEELVETDLEGYLEGIDDPTAETEEFELSDEEA